MTSCVLLQRVAVAGASDVFVAVVVRVLGVLGGSHQAAAAPLLRHPRTALPQLRARRHSSGSDRLRDVIGAELRGDRGPL